ncbi:MAG: branched-chain amino acid ABC transporter permease [Reinekea forsetii]|uniref:High-affinity branched-chain amino acid transport system permease protein LivH n=2 Tax=Reinekea TaxID=230494 RepID=A0A2K8KP34_9GAMM|nr:branched-chain amino acid ABC transporter permease [Reinekea forsetii]ATX76538.1 high-affinity branched-chain amino acid transport system permease protein LivH [Reinekea forsetii]MDO7641117.1 branched-chain amino acid ABC transporter permease [Reinekea forsetii]MDO7645672.1 branched-chain amino acid ABC transporter permease [Reinekea forsetii]MDO7675131.1 branched-chain amino acid ABC transporter permease [Reinekea forsetii]
MNELIFFLNKVLISGAVIGSIYAMGAIGITLIFSILRFAHFAHGDLMTTGAFITFALTALFPQAGMAIGIPTAFLMLPIAMVITSLLAVGIDKAFYKPLRNHNVKPIVLVMASIGVTLMLQGVLRLFFGTTSRNMFIDDRKEIFRLDLPWDLASKNIVITEPQILLFLFLIVAVVSLHLFLTRSRLGKAMRAMSDNADLARISGINVNLVVIVTWVIAGSLATAAGTLLALDVSLKPDLSFSILLPIFAAAIVGGVGHPYGAILGGFVVGFSETLAVFNWSILLRPLAEVMAWDLPANMALVPTEYKITVPFFILIAILVLKPTGILKGKVL